MKKAIGILLFTCILITSLILPSAAQKKAAPTNEFVPVLRFIAASDTHIQDDNNIHAERVQKMLDYTYREARADKNHPTLDALLLCGDVTHDGTKTEFEKMKQTLDSAVKPETRILAVAAMAHDGYDMKRAEVRDAITMLTGNEADFHVVIGGYHFIGISVSDSFPLHYVDAQRTWLKEQLDAATAQNPQQPVFVMQHEHIYKTVYGSFPDERWGLAYFKEVLEQYPQVVDFSGHSHYPLNHPNSVWQGAFTAVGTGAVKSTDFTVEDLRDIAQSPDNAKCSTFWIVEIDNANRMRLRGIDLLAEKVLCEYLLENPANPANREMSDENKAAKSTAPVFAKGAAIKVKTVKGGCTVTAPAAVSTDGFPIVLYRAFAKDASGKVITKTWTMPAYYLSDEQPEIALSLRGLGKGDYTVSVVAETAYGVQSAPLEKNITIDSPGQVSAFFARIYYWCEHAAAVIVKQIGI